MVDVAPRVSPAVSSAHAEPHRAVTGGWIAAFAVAWLGVWMAQLGPFRVELPLRVSEAVGSSSDWTYAVSVFGVVSGIAGIGMVVAFPVAGYLSDRTTSRFGRRRPWILGGSVVFALGLFALGFATTITLITVFWTLALIGFSVAASALTALISDAVPVRQRGHVSGWMSTPRALGIILGGLLFTYLFTTALFGYVAMGLCVLVFIVPILLVARETPLEAADRPTASMGALLRGMWISPKAHPDYARTWVSGALVTTGNALGTGLLLYYIAHDLGFGLEGARAAFLPLIVVYVVAEVLAALIAGIVSDRIRRRKIFVIWGALLQTFAALILVFGANYTATFVAAVLLGAGYGAYLSVGQALATQVIPDARDRGKDLGLMNVATQVPVALAPWLGALLVVTFGSFTGLYMVAAMLTAFGAMIVALVEKVK